MISPSRQLVVLSLLPLVLTFALYFVPAATPIILVIDIVVALVAMSDLLTLPRRSEIVVERTLGRVATRGEKHPIQLTVASRSKRDLQIEIRDDLDQSFDVTDEMIVATIESKSRKAFTYQITPQKRGEYILDRAHLMLPSRFNLWRIHLRTGPTSVLRVYPALKQIGRYAMYARKNQMSLLGLRRTRRAGNDNEFERLRDYTPDDQYRAIDWRATSRRLKLTVKDFQANQSQRIIFMIDCGRMMVNESSGFSLFDAAIDAALTLGFVALSRHDQVGLICFNDQVVRWIPPKSGKKHLNTLVHAVHDIEPTLVESRFDEAFLHLHRHCRKRSLVVLISNVIDDRNARNIEKQATNLVGQHLPLAVLLKDRELFAPLDVAAAHEHLEALNDDAVYRAAASADVALWREDVLTELRHAGVLTLDVLPEELTAPLINEYLRIKARMLL